MGVQIDGFVVLSFKTTRKVSTIFVGPLCLGLLPHIALSSLHATAESNGFRAEKRKAQVQVPLGQFCLKILGAAWVKSV